MVCVWQARAITGSSTVQPTPPQTQQAAVHNNDIVINNKIPSPPAQQRPPEYPTARTEYPAQTVHRDYPTHTPHTTYPAAHTEHTTTYAAAHTNDVLSQIEEQLKSLSQQPRYSGLPSTHYDASSFRSHHDTGYDPQSTTSSASLPSFSHYDDYRATYSQPSSVSNPTGRGIYEPATYTVMGFDAVRIGF